MPRSLSVEEAHMLLQRPRVLRAERCDAMTGESCFERSASGSLCRSGPSHRRQDRQGSASQFSDRQDDFAARAWRDIEGIAPPLTHHIFATIIIAVITTIAIVTISTSIITMRILIIAYLQYRKIQKTWAGKGEGKSGGKTGKGEARKGSGHEGGKGGKGGKAGKAAASKVPQVRKPQLDDSDSDEEEEEEDEVQTKKAPAASKGQPQEALSEEMKQMAALGLPVSFTASQNAGGDDLEEEEEEEEGDDD
eukprot:s6474_g2.t1